MMVLSDKTLTFITDNKNNPFCLTVIKSEEDYDPSIYEQKEHFLGFGKDKKFAKVKSH